MRLAFGGMWMSSASSTARQRGDRVHHRAHAADALGERPRVARIASLHDDLDAAKLR